MKRPKTRAELITKLYKDINAYSNSSKSSDSDVSDKKRTVNVKDEAVQAHFDDISEDEHCIGSEEEIVAQKCECHSDGKNSP